MRDAPDRQLQLDFQRRVPEPCTDCSNLAAGASSALHDARLTSATGGLGRCRRFLPNHTLAPLTSDVPLPLPRRRVNDAGFNASSGHLRSVLAAASPPLACTSAGLARSLPPSATTDSALERARQRSPTSAIDPRPEHTGERSLPGATPLFTARRCTSRCSGDARPHRSLRSEVSSARGAKAGSGPELDIQSPPSAPAHWRVTGSSEIGLGPPRERRANGRTLGNEPGCLSLCEIRPFLFEPDWPAQRAHAR
jgi:hypothetical protein